jgi:N-acetylneuraminic acid mutarotase
MELRFKWILLLFLSFILIFSSCGNDDDTVDLVGNWKKLGSFDGRPRSEAAAFVIDDIAYMGTGYYGTEDQRFQEFWKYDVSKDQWTQSANFPGVGRNGAVGFGVSGKGYLGTGFDGENRLKDFYEYTPGTNSWKSLNPFGGTARVGAIAFALNNYGYVGTGYDGNVLKDFYRYDPGTDTWTSITSIGGSKRRDASVFIIEGKAYVCMGNDNTSYVTDLWMFNPADESWTEKREIANISDDSYDDDYQIVGSNAVGFNIGTLGYITTGGASSPGIRTWEYNTLTDLWVERTSLEGNPRFDAVAFTVKGKAIVVGGRSGSSYFDDVWTFDPTAEQVDND